MLRILKDLERYTVGATDGDLGHVADFLLDDQRWTIRYLVVDTARFFAGRRVLVSPISFRNVDWATQRFNVGLPKDKLRNSPSIDLDKPVSRQHEREYMGYYGYPYYWGYASTWGMGGYPSQLADRPLNEPPVRDVDRDTSGDAHLRSSNEVRGYHIVGSDGALGHVANFIVDDATWEIRYLVVDTSNWWLGKKVLISPHWASEVSWVGRTVKIEMSRAAIKASPLWDENAAVNREYETRLYDYYGRPAYWTSDDHRITPVATHPNL